MGQMLSRYALRWMSQSDLEAVLSIDRASFALPWSRADLVDALRARSASAMLAECGGAVAGFVIYELLKTRIGIVRLAVDPVYRHEGAATFLLARLAQDLTEQRRRIVTVVEEHNLAAQLFLRACGFRCVNTQRQRHADDLYQFSYRAPLGHGSPRRGWLNADL